MRTIPRAHALLSFYNLRLGVPEDVRVDTRRRHETRILRDDDQKPQALTRERRGRWRVDRACIDAPLWDAQQRALPITLITRLNSNVCVDSTAGLSIADDPANAGVIQDLRVTLSSSREEWRLITYRPRRGGELPFLTNDFSLLPGVVAFLYFRRWEAEKCFDTWKNDFAQAKAWVRARWPLPIRRAWRSSPVCWWRCSSTPALALRGRRMRRRWSSRINGRRPTWMTLMARIARTGRSLCFAIPPR